MLRKKEVQKHYDEVASLYDQRDVTYPHVRAEFFRNLSFRKNDVVLDVGCGTGKFLLDFARNSGSVVGIDISIEMLRKNYCQIKKRPNIYLVCCDGEFLPFRRAIFDKITFIEAIEHIEKPRKQLNEMERVLKPHAKVFLTTPNALWSPVLHLAEKIGMKVTEGPTRHFSPRELRRLIDASNLSIEDYKGTVFFPRKSWKVMEKLSEFLNRLKLQDLCLKQIIICSRQMTNHVNTIPCYNEENQFSKLSAPVSIVIPAYNEAKTLDKSVAKLHNFLHQFCDEYEILIAEDGCNDGTDIIAKEIAENNDRSVVHLHYDEKLGRGGALKRAFKTARGEVLVYMDADLATDLSVIPDLIALTRQRKGMATASRYTSGSKVKRPILRKITSFCYNWLVRMLFRHGVHDHQCGCKAFHRDLIRDLLDEVESDEWFWDTEIIVRAKMKGFPVVEIPCMWSEPQKRKSKVKVFRDAISMGTSAIKLYWKLAS